jgi:hypothetical protein
VRGEGIERVAVHAALEQRAHELNRPGIELRTTRAAEGAPDQRRLEVAAVDAPDGERQQRRQYARQTCEVAPAPQEAGDVRQQRVVPRQRAVEIEQRKPRRGNARGGRKWWRAWAAQALDPASCRSTYCRMPPCR